ncbi:histidine phosphatase family protein [Novosphingobium beihaiensis]|uniref:Histidine phosphatase family protein n=1 Tax=Novosphingobium beihaiensis TaxID=2930389 RepID=A0ABT0BTF9_9SPHN|nr:histidine phosphatase family protein [Novosphingobium beihaiensis]MCJ2188344.1 histidine phosphatase family protein [Novosphingobium beihaiensis]
MFVIVRHGNTFERGEPPRRIGVRTDLPLTAAGHAQAEALGAHFAAQGMAFAKVLVSPLARTRQTAEAILRHLPGSPSPLPCAWLREIDHGPDENAAEDAILARIGAEALAAWDAQGVAPPGWEVDAEARIAAWQALFEEEKGPVLLVTSNGAARFALLAAGLVQGQESPSGLKLPTGGYGVIHRGERGGLTLAEWGVRP